MWFCSGKDGCGRRLKLDVNKIESRKEKVIMKALITVASLAKAGKYAMKPSGVRFKTRDYRLLHRLLHVEVMQSLAMACLGVQKFSELQKLSLKVHR